MRIKTIIILLLLSVTCACATAPPPPKPFGPIPTARQIKYHRDFDGFYAFVHYSLNAWTDREWGNGNESPKLFNPTQFDANQIVLAAKSAGMGGLILTAKHHDGFCLWPSQYTEHSVKNSPWKNGKGDVVKEMAAACKRHGIQFGVYISPWDRNHAEYGRAAYMTYYRNQIRELLTNYGPIFEIWFDGANGGSGYYGGANETRRIDRSTYYGWDETFALVRKLQPNCIIYSDIGPDIRWVGDGHRGITGDPCRATFTPKGLNGKPPGIGASNWREGKNGHRDGKFWIPAEDPMTIRNKGWFYHDNTKPRSLEALVKLYMETVGRGANLNLNLSPDRRGLIPDADVKRCQELGDHLRATFAHNLTTSATLTASNVRGKDKHYAPNNILDGNRDTYWSTDDTVKQAELIVEFSKPVTFNIVNIREYLPLGQRVENWALDQWINGKWVEFGGSKAIGPRRIWRGKTITTQKVRLRVDGPVCPVINEFGLYLEPKIVAEK